MLRIGITGANGLLGKGLGQILKKRHHLFLLTRSDADLTNIDQVMRALRSLHLDVLIHTAAIADPDICEINPKQALEINLGGTANLVTAAKELGFALALISSDAVFDGSKQKPYIESDTTHPLSVYGQTKVAAENELKMRLHRQWIFRVSVLFGPGKVSFVDKCLKALEEGKTCVAASDQIGSATYTLDAAEKILEVVEARRYGTYHLSNSGECSRLELFRHVASLAGLDATRVIGKTLAQMERPAPRPRYNVMKMEALEKAGLLLPRNWKDAVRAYFIASRRHTWG
ncbi:MAG: dTDP-4-dehydrorhamnose reductase [Terriglobales bacterium]